MVRHKKKDPDIDVRSIKQGLASIIRPEYRAVLIQIISQLSIEATKIACLASLLFLMMVMNDMTIMLFFSFFSKSFSIEGTFYFNL